MHAISFRRSMSLLALATVASHATGAQGLRVAPDTDVWPRWQARLGVTTAPARMPGVLELNRSPSVQGARLFGDYYFTGPGFGAGGVSGGFRATSGLLAGSRSLALGSPTLPGRQGSPFTLSSRSGPPTALADGAEGGGALPYLGVGYTGVSVRGGWGFTADVGLMGYDVDLGRQNGAQGNVDELLRELRLTPVLQLGVSYSF